jgi:acyl-CoA thioesterase I
MTTSSRIVLLLALAGIASACTRSEPESAGSVVASSESSRGLPGDGPSRVAGEGEPAVGARKPLEIPDDAPTVAFLGDSISAGLHLSADEAFPAVLQRELAAEGRPFRLVNAGVSGDTSAGGLRRVDWLLSRKPGLIVIELGGNDGLRGQPAESVEANLREIVRKAKAAGAKVLLLGIRLPPNLGEDYVASFEAVYARVAADEQVALVEDFLDGVGGVAELNLEDALHPTAEGHRKLAENVAPELRKVLEELTSK